MDSVELLVLCIVAFGVVYLLRRLVQGSVNKDEIRRALEAQGVKVVRIKRVDSVLNAGGGLREYGLHHVLVDEAGTHQIQLWRSDRTGVSRA